MNILELAEQNQNKVRKFIKDLNIEGIWRSHGADVNLVGSMRMGLLMKNLDADFHIYSAPLTVGASFAAIAELAAKPGIYNITYTNLIDTDEKCIEWHALYRSPEGEECKFDMIHILKGSFYDGYFERMADGITAVLTPELKQTILQLKYDTPASQHIAGVEYYRAAIEGKVRSFTEFEAWREKHPLNGISEWMP